MTSEDLSKPAWQQASFDTHPLGEESVLVTLVGVTNERIKILGNGFVIRAQGKGALCLTASHCFDHYKYMLANEEGGSELYVSPMFRPNFNYIKNDGIHAVYQSKGEFFFCRVRLLDYVDNYDVALFTAETHDESSVFERHVAIDLSAVEIGDEVAVMGNRLTENLIDPTQCEVSGHIIMRIGSVTEVEMGKSRMGFATFRTTIPIPNWGLSGSPIIRRPAAGAKVVACGVVSADFSTPEATESCSIAGDSAGTMFWPAMAQGLQMRIDGAPIKFTRLIELGIPGGIEFSTPPGVRVDVYTSSDKTQIVYQDERVSPPKIVVLDTRPHPLA